MYAYEDSLDMQGIYTIFDLSTVPYNGGWDMTMYIKAWNDILQFTAQPSVHNYPFPVSHQFCWILTMDHQLDQFYYGGAKGPNSFFIDFKYA